MSSRYLEIAHRVISVRGRPLTAQQILRDAAKYDLLPNDLSGDTMHKTLQARITEDISNNRENSAFYRTGLGMYFLRELSQDPTLAYSTTQEIEAQGRSRPPAEGRILCHHVPRGDTGITLLEASGLFKSLEATGSYLANSQIDESTYRVGTFSIIRNKDMIFQYKIGKHSPYVESRGRTAIGLRRIIDEYDRDLFSSDDFGIDMSAAREVLRNLSTKGPSPIRDERGLRENLHAKTCLIDHDLKYSWFILTVETHNSATNLSTPIRRLEVTMPHWVSYQKIDVENLDQLSKSYLSLHEVQT